LGLHSSTPIVFSVDFSPPLQSTLVPLSAWAYKKKTDFVFFEKSAFEILRRNYEKIVKKCIFPYFRRGGQGSYLGGI